MISTIAFFALWSVLHGLLASDSQYRGCGPREAEIWWLGSV